MFGLTQYKTPSNTGFALTTLSIAPVVNAFKNFQENKAISATSPMLNPATGRNGWAEWLLSGYMGNFLEWIGTQLAEVGRELFPQPSISEYKRMMKASKHALKKLFVEALLGENVQKEILEIMAIYLHHGATLINAGELPLEKWKTDLKKLAFQAKRAKERDTVVVLKDWIEHLALLQKKRNQELGERDIMRAFSTYPAVVDVATLNGINGFKITDSLVRTRLGYSVSNAGDINGDGFGDLIIGAPYENYNQGASYVIFGQEGNFSSTFNVSALNGNNGFKITTSREYQNFASSVSGAGDVNGDGFDDLIIGGNDYKGPSYVIFGKEGGFFSTFNVSTLDGSNGFKIISGVKGNIGYSVSGAGDMNKDGFDDLILGAYMDRSYQGAIYVIFGQEANFSSTFNVSTLDGNNGFKMISSVQKNYFGLSVSNAGDVNGDGFDDVIIGSKIFGESAIYVIFGQATAFPSVWDVSSLNGTNGFKVINCAPGSGIYSNTVASGARDVNQDGFDDLIIGAPHEGTRTSVYTGVSYVIFGRINGFPSVWNISAFNSTDGFKMYTNISPSYFGWSVDGIGDVNADGFDDFIIGAWRENNYKGASYVVFGQINGFPSNLNLNKLNGGNGFKITSNIENSYLGYSVSSAGDVNGDGYDDLIIAAANASPGGRSSAGEAYVVFGQPTFTNPLELSSLNGSNGFQMNGVLANDAPGISVSGAGDLNGDGYDDVVVGVVTGAPSDVGTPGRTYVVFGMPNFTTPLELSSLNGSNGFQLNGVVPSVGVSGASWRYVAGAEDINGDGYDDLLIGAYAVSPEGRFQAGQSYVVYGSIGTIAISPSPTPTPAMFRGNVDLSTFPSAQGFVINGAAVGDTVGYFVSGTKDVNGDDIPDILVGANLANAHGQSYLVYGGQSGTINLASFPSVQGFIIDGAGIAVSGTGDLNQDGIPDLLVGTDAYDSFAGAAYVVYGGQNGTINLANFPNSQGFVVVGATSGGGASWFSGAYGAGYSVSGAGDVNQDGIPDILVGTYNSGSAYLVYGAQNGTIDLSTFPSAQGFMIEGVALSDRTGYAVRGIQDINGDRIPDLLVGAPHADADAGAAYVVYGGQSGTIDLASFPSSQGFVMKGAALSTAGCAVSGTGDINGDDIPDLLIGAVNGNQNTGAAYVVYGGQNGTIDLSTFPSAQGFVIQGLAVNDEFGFSVSGTGDVNKDGISDLLIGARYADSSAGAAYVIYGGQGTTIDLSTFPSSQGFVIQGTAGGLTGYSVSGLGDVNGDGIADMLVGAIYANSNTGAAYVVYGQSSSLPPTPAPVPKPSPAPAPTPSKKQSHLERNLLIGGIVASGLLVTGLFCFFHQKKRNTSGMYVNPLDSTRHDELTPLQERRDSAEQGRDGYSLN